MFKSCINSAFWNVDFTNSRPVLQSCPPLDEDDPILSFSDRRVVGLEVRAGWIQFTSRFGE